MQDQPNPNEQPKQIALFNFTAVPLVGGPGNGRRITFEGLQTVINVRRPPTVLTVNPQEIVTQERYIASFFRIGDKTMAIYRHESVEEDQAFVLIFMSYGLFDVEKPRGRDSGSKGKAVH